MIQFLDAFFYIVAGIFLLRLFLEETGHSLFNPNPLFKLLHRITEPVLVPIRKILPDRVKDKLYIDISPLVVIVLIIALKILSIKILPVLSSRFAGILPRLKPKKPF